MRVEYNIGFSSVRAINHFWKVLSRWILSNEYRYYYFTNTTVCVFETVVSIQHIVSWSDGPGIIVWCFITSYLQKGILFRPNLW